LSALSVSLITFVLVFGGALLGMYLRNALADHLREDVRDAIRLSVGLIGTMAALVLGLLIASAKSSYDTTTTQIKQITADIVLLDLELVQYGPETVDLRSALRKGIPPLINRIWTESNYTSSSSPFVATVEAADFVKKLQQLQPSNDSKRALQAQILSTTSSAEQLRLALFTQSHDAIPAPFLVILIFWLTIIFTSFGLFVRSNRIVVVTFFVGALSVASAILLILEMGQPFAAGLMQISSEALRHALAPLGS
jgi:hypothetical protein